MPTYRACKTLWKTCVEYHTFYRWVFSDLGPVSRKSRELFGPEKLVVKLQSACFEKLIFLHVFNIRKTKRIAKFYGLEPRRCEDIKGIVAPEIDPKSFGTFEKRAPAHVRIKGETFILKPHLRTACEGLKRQCNALLSKSLALLAWPSASETANL